MKLKNSQSSNGDGGLKSSGNEPLWTVKDVATYLRLEQETVRIMARANKLPAMKVGKAWRFKAGDIKEMLKSRTD